MRNIQSKSETSSFKIKVFISSKCDRAEDPPKYNPIRKELKQAIEKTGLASVYTFEDEPASTWNAGEHYTFALEDSDICIFLIDNADGIPAGVQREVDVVERKQMKALYYFCDEHQKEKTSLEKSLIGANHAKSKTIHTFSELSQNGATALIEDIIFTYHNYCIGRLQVVQENDLEKMQALDIAEIKKYHEASLPKAVLKCIDKSTDYILTHTAGVSYTHFSDQPIQTSELDDWGLQFLPILFEGKSIKEFNTALFLDCLKSLQEETYFNIVKLRWAAIQSYYNGNIATCVNNLDIALAAAKSTNQPSWIINDLLIDLRNLQLQLNEEQNIFSYPDAQKELDESNDEIYYPFLDRANESLQEKYIQGLYEKQTQSPYTVSIGNDLSQYGKLLASIFVVALYNGSLTHILLLDERIRDFLFYLSNRYDDWNLKRDLFKYTIKTKSTKEVSGLQNTHPEILGKLSQADAKLIMDFCSQHPIKYKRTQQQLLAFGTIGYYLDDDCFEIYKIQIISLIYSWLDDEHSITSIGSSIFDNLTKVSYRLSQDTLADICCRFIDKHYRRWYSDMFKFISKCINIQKMSEQSASNLINHIILILQDENDRKQIQSFPSFLGNFRKQNRTLTEALDAAVEKYLPSYYKESYKLETIDSSPADLLPFIEAYVQKIKKSNEQQGTNGTFFGHGEREIATLRFILIHNKLYVEDNLMDLIVTVTSQTLLESKESTLIKMDAIALLCCIIVKYPQVYIRNEALYQGIMNRAGQISSGDDFPFFSNIDGIALKIGLKILSSAMGNDVHADFLELLPYLNNDTATTISITNFIAEYLETSEDVVFPRPTESIILMNAFAWLHMDYVDIRWNATRILLALLRNSENQDIINRQIVSLIDTDNVYIKNLILQRISKTPGIRDDTKNYVTEVCSRDANYITKTLSENIEYFD